ncbi:MAG: shikimate kinase [Lachnospiraceae bacterium]|nr:shikimate kinase [Lachnospiraceae bacterium]
MRKDNIVLIGMPASGKSTAGVILAKVLGKKFIDTDLVIQEREKALLADIIKDKGVAGFMKIEEEAILSVDVNNTVIATGGSAVYGEKAMEHLKENGTVVYLKVEKDELFKRLTNIKERGVVLREGENIEEMYDSHIVLYEKYADIIIEERDSTIEETIRKIQNEL